MNILAIDPGTTQSAWLYRHEGGERFRFGIFDNHDVAANVIHAFAGEGTLVAIESVESFGMAVGKEVFETVHWAGRFYQAAWYEGAEIVRVPRREVKLFICQDSRANDANIRQALIDRYGGKDRAVGRKATPGPLYGITKDVWSALAIAITAQEHDS